MKHSDSGPMSDDLQSLYVDLCNLVVESRAPNDAGFGAGAHCPPLMGPLRHMCDLSRTECQKHQTIIHHLLEAAASNIFQIEVLLLPECCLESKLKERIQSKEYILLERWSMNLIHGKVDASIEVAQLLRAVRSFLHFSQLSAWLSSTSGKSPTNIYYWVNPDLESICSKFKQEPEMHTFPICKINDNLSGAVKVEFPSRTQYVPLIPCSKHPPICRFSLREINKDSELCHKIAVESEMVKQLHKTSDIEGSKLTGISYVTESVGTQHPVLLLTPTTLLKTLSTAIPDESKANRVLKHSNLQENIFNSTNLPLDLKTKNSDISSKPTTLVCNYMETLALGVSQENLCYSKLKLNRRLLKTDIKLRKSKKASSPLLSESNSPKILDSFKINQNVMKHSSLIEKMESSNNLLSSIKSSLVTIDHTLSNSSNLTRLSECKLLKRKKSVSLEHVCMLPNKKLCCDMNNLPQLHDSSTAIEVVTSLPHCSKSSLKEKANPFNKLNKVFPEYISSTVTIPDIKDSEMKYQHCSKYLFPFTNKTENGHHFLNFASSYSDLNICGIPDSSIFSKSKLNIPFGSSESNTLNTILRSEFEHQINVERKCNSVGICNENLFSHSNSICAKAKCHPNIDKDCNMKCLDFKTGKSDLEMNYEKPQSMTVDNTVELKSMSLCQNNCKVLKSKMKSSMKISNEKHFSKSKKGPELGRVPCPSLHKVSKINSLFKFKKNYQNDFKGKINRILTSENAFDVSKSSLIMSDEANTLSFNKGHCYIAVSKLPHTQVECSKHKNASYSELTRYTLNAMPQKISTHNDYQNYGHSSNLNSLKIVSPQNSHQNYFSNSSVPINSRNLCPFTDENLECFPKYAKKFPKEKKLLVNFEESILKGCLPIVSSVKGFHAEIGASGSFCPNHLTLPADVSFYELGHPSQGTAPYVAHVSLNNSEYYLPRKGAVQVTLFNPSETVVKMFVLNYDLSSMPPLSHTFIRQKIYYLPVGLSKEYPASQKWLRFIIHLRFASSKTGRIFLHEDFKIVVLNKTNDDAASEFSQEPRELCSFLSVPMNPTFSNI